MPVLYGSAVGWVRMAPAADPAAAVVAAASAAAVGCTDADGTAQQLQGSAVG